MTFKRHHLWVIVAFIIGILAGVYVSRNGLGMIALPNNTPVHLTVAPGANATATIPTTAGGPASSLILTASQGIESGV